MIYPERTCQNCGNCFTPKQVNQATCSTRCSKRKAERDTIARRKANRQTGQPEVVTTETIHKGRVDRYYAIIAAPPEYIDWKGMVYTSIELECALNLGALPPGVIFRRGAQKVIVRGEPTPIDFCLSGLGHYNHQKLEVIK